MMPDRLKLKWPGGKRGSKELGDGSLAPKWGQIGLAGVLLASIIMLIASSLSSIQVHQIEGRQILAEESDASALIFVQRESFNTIVAINDWSDGLITARDVQIARALLGQRLGVVTSSGLTTYDQTTAGFQHALPKLDAIIRSMTTVDEKQREAFTSVHQRLLNHFREQIIHLNSKFERLSRTQILRVADARASAEQQQALLLLLILILGTGLSVWLAVDIVRQYRRTSRMLREQRVTLEGAQERVLMLHDLEEASRNWLALVSSGAKSHLVLKRIKDDLMRLMPALTLDFITNHKGEVVLVTKALNELTDDQKLVTARVQEVIQIMATRDESQRALEFQRDFDPLTQLPNRDMFAKNAEVAVRIAQRNQRVVGMMLLDIDRFNDVNSSLGYAIGDDLLVQVAHRLSVRITAHEQAARLSADEFGVLISGKDVAEVVARAQSLFNDLTFRTELGGFPAEISMSAGLSLYDPQSRDTTDLARCAAMAIYLAKAPDERRGFVVYDREKHESIMNTWHEELAVRNALRSGEFKVYFQPIVDLADGHPVGVEALVRWERPGFGLVMPGEFLPLVQRAGIMVELGWLIIEDSLKAWRNTISHLGNDDDAKPYVSINLDSTQLQDPNLADFIIAAVQRNQVNARSVVLEVTEYTLVNDPISLTQIRQLRDFGIRIAIDDFGSGYNNLGQAHQLPLDILKIDRSFLPEPTLSDKSVKLITDIKAIAEGLDLAVIVEGVETPAVADSLRQIGLRYAQGYLYSRAMQEDELSIWFGHASV
jgi:diguanylate cyclase (GGDEF)-like protein